MSKTFKTLLAAFVVVVVIVGGLATFMVLRDSADDAASLGAITGGPSTTGYGGGAGARTTADGAWKVQTGEGVFVGYRVHEKLRGLDKEVTGRSPGVTGSMTVAGSSITAAEFTGDLTGLTSDDPLRDNAIKGQGPQTSRFPEAKFVLTGPLALPTAPVVDRTIEVTAKGNLTLHGVTKPVDVPLTAKWDGSTIRVATAGGGARFQFQDFGFDALSVPVATTDDFGFLEVQLLFVPA